MSDGGGRMAMRERQRARTGYHKSERSLGPSGLSFTFMAASNNQRIVGETEYGLVAYNDRLFLHSNLPEHENVSVQFLDQELVRQGNRKLRPGKLSLTFGEKSLQVAGAGNGVTLEKNISAALEQLGLTKTLCSKFAKFTGANPRNYKDLDKVTGEIKTPDGYTVPITLNPKGEFGGFAINPAGPGHRPG